MANNHFKLTLDTIAPVGSITRPAEFMKTNANLAITKGDATYMKVWFTQSETGSTEDAAYDAAEWKPAAAEYLTDFKADGNYYYHLQLQDDVANLSPIYNTQIINFDTQAPSVTKVTLSSTTEGESTTITRVRANKIAVTMAETSATASGIDHMVITGNIAGSPVTISNPKTNTKYDFTFTGDAKDGQQTLSVVVYDRAGNASAPVTGTITLDTKAAEGTLHLRENATATDDLGDFVNESSFTAVILVDSTDVVGYKIWGDVVDHTSEPTSYTSSTGTEIKINNLSFTAADGSKTVHAKIIDRAGNETTLTDVSLTYDKTEPSVTLTTNKAYICGHDSTGDVYATATLTMKASDATSGVNSWRLSVGSTTLDSGTSNVDKTFALTAANSLTEDEFNTITLTVTDKAGNSKSKSVQVYVDTQPASISTTALQTWYHNGGTSVDGGTALSALTINVTANDAGSGVKQIEAWTNGTQSDHSVPTDTPVTSATSGQAKTLTYSDIRFDRVESASNWLHIKVTDNVGNESYTDVKFGYDSVAPTGTPSFNNAYYGSTTAVINLNGSDTGSGIAYYKITPLSSSITDAPSGWQTYTATKTVTLSSTDGTKEAEIQFKDVAGNVSQAYKISTVLDTKTNVPTLTILEADGKTPKEDPSSSNTVAVKIEDKLPGTSPLKYKIYGDWSTTDKSTTKTSADDVDWTSFPADHTLTLTGYSTIGDGPKEIYVMFTDEAGHTSNPVKVGFTLDTEAPTVEIKDETRTRISCAHVLIANKTEESGKGDRSKTYGDVVNFNLVPSENIIAWKVCAYKTAAEATAATGDTATPIGTTGGSVNMSGHGLDSKAAIECTVRGSDYKAALGNPEDGIYYILAFVQDKSKTWSVAGTIAA